MDYIKKVISDYLIEKQKNNDRDTTKFHPSSIGKCSREITYMMLGYPQPDIDPRVLMVFENGHSFHNRMEWMFDKAGILIAPELPIQNEELNISGRTDAVIRNPHPNKDMFPGDVITLHGWKGEVIYQGPNRDVALVELKSINNKGFNKVVDKTPKPEHVWQLQLYMFLTGIKQGVVYYENKDTQQQWECWVTYDPTIVATLIEKIKKINECIKNGSLPARENSRTSFVCSWCNYHGLCWGDAGAAYKSIDELI